MACDFRVGQPVVCIKGVSGYGTEIVPPVGGVYTIREFGSFGGIRLVEIINTPMRYIEGMVECTFDVESFRPVVERKTDISIFRAMLNTTPETGGAQ